MKKRAKRILALLSLVMVAAVIFSLTAAADYTGYSMLYTTFDDSHWKYILKYSSGESTGLRPYCYEDFTVVKLARYQDDVFINDDNVLEIRPSSMPGNYIVVLCSNYSFETLATFEYSNVVANLDLVTVFGSDFDFSLILIETLGDVPYVTVPLADNDIIGVFSFQDDTEIENYEAFLYNLVGEYYDYVSFFECVSKFHDYFDKDISIFQSGFNSGFEYLLNNFEILTYDERVVALKEAVYNSGYLTGYMAGQKEGSNLLYQELQEEKKQYGAFEWQKGYAQGKGEAQDAARQAGWEACMKEIEKTFGDEWETSLNVSLEELRENYYNQGFAKGKLENVKKSFNWTTAFGDMVDEVFSSVIDSYNSIFDDIYLLGHPLRELLNTLLFMGLGFFAISLGKKLF